MAEPQGWTKVEEPTGWTKVEEPAGPKWGDPSTPTTEGMLRRQYTGHQEGPPSKLENLNEALQGPAHPTSLGDLMTAIVPSGGAGGLADRAIQAVQRLPLARIGLGTAGAAYGAATAPDNSSTMARVVRAAKYGAGAALAPNLARAIPGVGPAVDALATKVGEFQNPLTVAGREASAVAASRAFNDLPLAQQMEHLPPTSAPLPPSEMVVRPGAGKMADVRMLRGRVVEPPPRNLGAETQVTAAAPSAATPSAPATLSPSDRAALLKQGYPPELVARIEQRLAQDQGIAPMASHQPSMVKVTRVTDPNVGLASNKPTTWFVKGHLSENEGQQLLDSYTGGRGEIHRVEVPESEILPSGRTQGDNYGDPIQVRSEQLRQPRINIGAEQVGRQAGMTKETVRQVTGPVLDEATGDASPIFPKNTLTKIVDDMRALPPGAEREAYVARATSGKAKWQVENIRRTLEHLGLLVPLASSDVRDAVMQRLMPSHASGSQP